MELTSLDGIHIFLSEYKENVNYSTISFPTNVLWAINKRLRMDIKRRRNYNLG